MNKEEILNTFLLANIPEIITQEEFDDVKKAIKQLQKENKKYKEVIDKALDFIDCHFKEMVADEEAQELKSILKEVE